MLTRVLRYLRSQVLGLVAIFIALGGTGYAAMQIPKHSIGQRALKNGAVGSKQLRKHSVTNAKLAKGSVGSTQLRKGSVQDRQLKNGSVTSAKLGAGSVGNAQLAAGSVGPGQLVTGSVGPSQLAAGAVGSGQLAAGSVGNAQLAAGSVGPAQLTGIASYTSAFAIVDTTGKVVASDPAATTSSWSNGTGTVSFQGTLAASTCIPESQVPAGSGDGASVASSAIISPGTPSTTAVGVVTAPPNGTSQLVVVTIECAG